MTGSLLKLLSNAKTRTLVLLVGGILVGGVIIAIVSSGKTGEPLEKRVSKTTQVPKGVESTPGAKTSERYRELQEKANIIGSETAERKGGTFIPTIVADNKSKNDEDLQSQFLKALSQTDSSKLSKVTNPSPKTSTQDPRLAQLLAQQKQDELAAEAFNKQRQAQLNAERMAALQEQRLKAIETVAQAMEEQTKAAFNAWNDVPIQAYNIGEWELEKQNQTNAKDDSIDDRPVVLKAGSILFGVLETAVNSDEPGPIMAKIMQPPFKDAKLIGKMELPPDKGEKITLRFDTFNIPTEPISNKISAVAIDPDTARTALATEVDHHYLLRWGTLFGSAFLEGYSKAVGKSGTKIQTSTVPGQTSTTTDTPQLSGRQQLFEGLGEVGTKWSEQLKENFNRKPTITIESGTGIGILILADVKLGPEPEQKERPILINPAAQTNANSLDILNAIVQNAAKINNSTNTPAVQTSEQSRNTDRQQPNNSNQQENK